MMPVDAFRRLQIAPRGAISLLLVGVGLSLGACPGRICGDNEPTDDVNTPVVDNFWVPDSQIPGDPWTVLFGVDFTDPDGDLSAGVAEFFLNSGTSPAVQILSDAFRQSGVTLDETLGTAWMALRFSDTMDDGTNVRLGLQLVDGAGNRSNCYTLELKFDVTPVASIGGAPSIHAVAARAVNQCGGSL